MHRLVVQYCVEMGPVYKLTKLSLHNRALIALITIVAAIFGMISFANMREELVPSVSFPTVLVSASYPGASAQVMDDQVGSVIEQSIQGVDGLQKSTSSSTQGSSTITAQFDYGTDTLVSEQKVQQAVNRVAQQLPDSVSTSVLSASSSDIPVVALAASWDDDSALLGQQLQKQTVVDLQSIAGVRAASLNGVPQQQVNVRVDLKKMDKQGITVAALQQALQSSGVVVPAGSITENGSTLSVQAGAQFTSTEQIENVRVSVQKTPEVKIPDISVPSFTMPSLTMPSFSMPAIPTPSIPTPSLPTALPSLPSSIPLKCVSAAPSAGAAEQPEPSAFTLNCELMLDAATAGQVTNVFTPSGAGLYGQLRQPSVVPNGTTPQSLQQVKIANPQRMAKDPFKDALKTVRIGDVASVKVVNQPQTSVSRVNTRPAISMSVTKTSDASAVEVSQAVRAALPTLQTELGHGAKLTVVYDQAPYIQQSIESLMTEGMFGLAFAVLIILLFLFSFRATIVTAVSIPTSIFITAIGMQAAGYSLNILTLGAITIAVGRVVDDSIVVVENIRAHLNSGQEKLPGIIAAVKEVAGAIIASTVTTVAVFLPIGFVGGLSGELFRPFAFTVSIALMASLFVALTIVPVLSYWWLGTKRRGTKPKGQSVVDEQTHAADTVVLPAVESAAPGGINRLENEGKRLRRGYKPILTASLRHPWLTVGAATMVFLLSLGLAGSLKTDFLGDSGAQSLQVTQTNSAGASLENRIARAKLVEDIALRTPGVSTVLSTLGVPSALMSFSVGAGDGSNSFSVTLKASADGTKVAKDLQQRLATLKNAGEVTVDSSGGAGVSQNIQLSVFASDQESLTAGTNQLASALQAKSAVQNVESSLKQTQPLIKIQVKQKQAAEAGLSELTVAQAVAQKMSPTSIGDVTLENRQLNVYVYAGSTPDSLKQLRESKVTTQIGDIKLSDLANIDVKQAPTTVSSQRGRLASTITLDAANDNLSTANAAVASVVKQTKLPTDVTVEVGGVTLDQQNTFASLGLALLVAILIVYTVMVATFKSLLQPLLLLISVPFAVTGVFLILRLTDTPLGIAAMVGMLMLIGIVVTNAIVLVDLVNQYRRAGESVYQALMDGASRRLRPILMTALATIFALMPMALGITGHSGFISKPLAIVVIGGLFSSTLLTLIVVPSLYWLVCGRQERKQRKARARATKQAG